MERPRTLSAAFVKTVKAPGRYGDGRGGHGLTLLVKESSTGRYSKSWAQRLRINGEPFNIGLGSYPIVTLKEARDKAFENQRAVEQGKDPRVKKSSTPTFADAAEIVIGIHAPGWKKGRHESNWRRSLSQYAYPTLGAKLVSEITSLDVMALLVPIWNEKRETARKLRQRIGAVMKWAVAQGYRADNPAGEAIGAALPKKSHVTQHRAALPHEKVTKALAMVRETGAWKATKLCFEFLTLTATRSGEARLAEWPEFDLEMQVWTIPASRFKGLRGHRVPLSDQAIEVLREARELKTGDGMVFPSITGKVLTDSTVSKLLRENNIGCVPHGMRTSFRVWAAECTDAPREIAEMCLLHAEGSAVELAYRRTDYFVARRALMQQWADYISPSTQLVYSVPLVLSK